MTLSDLANMVMGGAVSALFIIIGYYVKQGLDARNGKIDRRSTDRRGTPAPHTCRFSGDLESMIADVKSGMDEIFKRIMQVEHEVLESVKGQGKIQVTLATLTSRTEWLQSAIPIEVDNQETGQRIALFVDDQIESFKILYKEIENIGFKLHTADSVGEAENALECYKYDFAIIDANLSAYALDGIQLARMVRQRFPDTKVIIYTGMQLESIPPGCQYVEKPGFTKIIELLKGWK